MATNITMLNHEVNDFANYLLGLELKGKETRMRTRFVKLLATKIQQIEEERLLLIKSYAYLDNQGNPVTKTDEKGNGVYDLMDTEGFNNEYLKMQNEPYVIVQDESNSDMLKTIESIVLNDERPYSGVSAVQYDRWCEIIEQVSA